MKYWIISGSNPENGGGVSIAEINEDRYKELNKSFGGDSLDGNGLYIRITTEENEIEKINQDIVDKIVNYIDENIKSARETILYQENYIKKLQNNPTYKASQRNKQIEEILN